MGKERVTGKGPGRPFMRWRILCAFLIRLGAVRRKSAIFLWHGKAEKLSDNGMDDQ